MISNSLHGDNYRIPKYLKVSRFFLKTRIIVGQFKRVTTLIVPDPGFFCVLTEGPACPVVLMELKQIVSQKNYRQGQILI